MPCSDWFHRIKSDSSTSIRSNSKRSVKFVEYVNVYHFGGARFAILLGLLFFWSVPIYWLLIENKLFMLTYNRLAISALIGLWNLLTSRRQQALGLLANWQRHLGPHESFHFAKSTELNLLKTILTASKDGNIFLP